MFRKVVLFILTLCPIQGVSFAAKHALFLGGSKDVIINTNRPGNDSYGGGGRGGGGSCAVHGINRVSKPQRPA